jgi:hypothetical protein
MGNDMDGDGKGEPVTTYRKPNVSRAYPRQPLQTTDEFNGSALCVQCHWHANPNDEWLRFEERGRISLTAIPSPEKSQNLWTVPNLLLQKLPAYDFTVTTFVDVTHLLPGERSGLVIMGRDYSYIAVLKSGSQIRLIRITSSDEEDFAVELKNNFIYLRVRVSEGAICNFSFSRDGKNFESLGEGFKAKPGIWIGAKVGLFALGPPETTSSARGHADYDWFRFSRPARSGQTRARVQ